MDGDGGRGLKTRPVGEHVQFTHRKAVNFWTRARREGKREREEHQFYYSETVKSAGLSQGRTGELTESNCNDWVRSLAVKTHGTEKGPFTDVRRAAPLTHRIWNATQMFKPENLARGWGSARESETRTSDQGYNPKAFLIQAILKSYSLLIIAFVIIWTFHWWEKW